MEIRDHLFDEDGRPAAVTLLLLRELSEEAPDFAPTDYLLGFRLTGLKEHRRAIPYFEKALAGALPHPALVRESRWRLAEALFREGRLDEAAAVFRQLDAEGEPASVRLTARDRLSRIAWWRANPGRAVALPVPSRPAGGAGATAISAGCS